MATRSKRSFWKFAGKVTLIALGVVVAYDVAKGKNVLGSGTGPLGL